MAYITTNSNALATLSSRAESLFGSFQSAIISLEEQTSLVLDDLAQFGNLTSFSNSSIGLNWYGANSQGAVTILGSGFTALPGGTATGTQLDLDAFPYAGGAINVHMAGAIRISQQGLGGYITEASLSGINTAVAYTGRTSMTTGLSTYSSVSLIVGQANSPQTRLTLTGNIADDDEGVLRGTVTGLSLAFDPFGGGQNFQTFFSVSNIAVPAAPCVAVADIDRFLGKLFSGDDSIDGTNSTDTLYGYGGDDTLNGSAGPDTLIGGTGDDTYVIDDMGDQIVEAPGEGEDSADLAFFAGTGAYTLAANVENGRLLEGVNWSLLGNASDNSLRGNALANTLDAGGGDDTLDGRGGADLLIGGAGDDLYVIDSLGDTLVEESGGGHDGVRVGIYLRGGSYTLADNVEHAVLTCGVAFTLVGNDLDNSLVGNYRNDVLRGGAGDDVLDGRRGADMLAGGEGNDALRGGAGGDRFVFDAVLNAATNVDSVLDFASGDRLVLDDAIFSALAGGISAANLASGAGPVSATTADEHLLYNTTTGELYYDADASGAGAATLFALIHLANGHPPGALSAADFALG